MKVELSGFNYDREFGDRYIKTPETLCAAYARISRSSKSIKELREESAKDIVNARRSNEKIVFQLGHSSIAEHAVFNFDLVDISRLAIEYIQHHRLAAFTEKSQRYVNTHTGFIIPYELKDDKDLLEKFVNFNKRCFQLYEKSYEYLNQKNDRQTSNEDSRYFLPLSTLTQCGMTLNGRTLEYMISRLKSQNIVELYNIANELEKESTRLSPSIIKYTQPDEKFKDLENIPKGSTLKKSVKLLKYDYDGFKRIISSYLFHREGKNLSIKNYDENSKKNFIKNIFKNLKSFDKPPREFELVDFTFLISCSASCYAQLKRHRMATIITQGYDINSKPVIPETLKNTPFEKKLLNLALESKELSLSLYGKNPLLYKYAVLNSTKRKVILKMNVREIYHFVRLRSDKHAQWEIRDISNTISDIVKMKEPILFEYLSGKDFYDEKR